MATSPSQTSRRAFLKTSAVGLGLFQIVPTGLLGQNAPSKQLRIAGIGVGGRGRADINGVSKERIVALCDVDWQRAADTFGKYPQAKRYRDYREMLEKEAKNIDAVVIGTPDHMHAPPAVMAMTLGKHVYVEKPMAHTMKALNTPEADILINKPYRRGFEVG